MTTYTIGYLDRPTTDGRRLMMPFSARYPVMIRDETLEVVGEATRVYPSADWVAILCDTEVPVPDGWVLTMNLRNMSTVDSDGLIIITDFAVVGLDLIRAETWAWA